MSEDKQDAKGEGAGEKVNKPNMDRLVRILDRIIKREERKGDKPAA